MMKADVPAKVAEKASMGRAVQRCYAKVEVEDKAILKIKADVKAKLLADVLAKKAEIKAAKQAFDTLQAKLSAVVSAKKVVEKAIVQADDQVMWAKRAVESAKKDSEQRVLRDVVAKAVKPKHHEHWKSSGWL